MARPSGSTKADRELAAIGSILDALDGLEGESIQRVLDYVFSRLSISRSGPVPAMSPTAPVVLHATAEPVRHVRNPSIRDLKEEKRPESANQMAALVAYYLSEAAPADERQDTISASDLEKYFKQAGYKLPKALSQALPNAAAAGYFEGEGNGKYRLNPVGYNLVVHGLPRGHGAGEAPRKRSRGKAGRK